MHGVYRLINKCKNKVYQIQCTYILFENSFQKSAFLSWYVLTAVHVTIVLYMYWNNKVDTCTDLKDKENHYAGFFGHLISYM